MENMYYSYNTVGVIKSQICSALANSEAVREALNYTGVNAKYEYDEEDPMTLIYNGIIPFLQDPDVIETTDPVILVGVELRANGSDPYLYNATVDIVCTVDKDHLRTQKSYNRQDLLERDGGFVCYTRADWIADEVVKCLSKHKGTWIGDIEVIDSAETPMSQTRYCRHIKLRLYDVAIGKDIQNG